MIIRDLALSRFLETFQVKIEPVDELFSYYRCALMEVETKFKVLNEQFALLYDGNPIESIKTRIKSYDSILRKLKSKGFPLTLKSMEENVFDVAGVRVICSFEKDIYVLESYFLSQDDVVLVERKGYIKNPKKSGYRSLHLLIEIPIFLSTGKKMMKVEVQLRTIAMDFWASLEHKLRYHKDLTDEQLILLKDEMKTCATMCKELDQRMQYAKDEILGKEDNT